MSEQEVIMVRIYLSEHKAKLSRLLDYLRDQGLCGASVFRAIAGFGPSGVVHSAGLTDLSLDLPLIVEFYDRPEVVERLLPELSRRFDPGHIVHWRAQGLAPEVREQPA